MENRLTPSELSCMVASLPEVYQPIYGHAEYASVASRSCQDRFAHVAFIVDILAQLLGRSPRVLDLGCAQGYFSFGLAERGALVHGVDCVDENVELCRGLANGLPGCKVGFSKARIEDVLSVLEPDEYDLVLGLSVFHHIAHERGAEFVQQLLRQTAERVAVAIVEMALCSEPLYWAAAQPTDPRRLLDGFAFVHELARVGTHLSPVARPIYVASNRLWFLSGQAGPIDACTHESHALAKSTHEGSRTYLRSSSLLVKHFRLDHPLGAYNRADLEREAAFLAAPPAGLATPNCEFFDCNMSEAWLIRQWLPGTLLLDLFAQGKRPAAEPILRDILRQLCVLEKAGLYHNDIRAWNVLVADDGRATLIDYGAITAERRDCVWPDNIYLSFLIFVRELATGVVEAPDLLRLACISPFNLPQPFRQWAAALWQRPLKEWNFQLMLDLLEASAELQTESLEQPLDAWMQAIESALNIQTRFSQRVDQRLAELGSRVQDALADAREARAAARDAKAASAALLNSRTWRTLTAPVRWIRKLKPSNRTAA